MTGGAHGGHAPTMHGPRWLSITLAVVLGVAAILAGITAWRSTLMEGDALKSLTLSTQAVNDANTLDQEAERSMTGERDLFIQFQSARTTGDADLAESVRGMMSAKTRDAIEWWAEQPAIDRPVSPFVSANPEWDAPGVVIDATAALQASQFYRDQAEGQLSKAHNLEFVAALLTIAFLAGGLSGLFESTRARMSFLSVSIFVLAGCLVGTVVFW